MDQPLGRDRNALEIREAVARLRGEGPPDFVELVLAATAHLLVVSTRIDEAEARARGGRAIGDGTALAA
jgi:pyrimidine-nucleoside phosphorylase